MFHENKEMPYSGALQRNASSALLPLLRFSHDKSHYELTTFFLKKRENIKLNHFWICTKVFDLQKQIKLITKGVKVDCRVVSVSE